ncbi:MAG: DUF3618 domain-containing protein [Rhodospirillales bacterium]
MPADNAQTGSNTGSRRPDEIETDIAETRARIDRTVASLRDAVSTERMAGAATDAVRDQLAGRPNRIADTIRAHPVPAALVGVGLAWLALAFGRPSGGRARVAATGDLPGLLARIAADATHGSESLRRAAALLAGTAAADPLRRGAADFAAVAGALASQVRAAPSHGDEGWAAPSRGDGGWARVDGLTPSVPLPDALSRIADRLDGTVALTRAALRRELPDPLRVALGAHLHETIVTLDRVRALRDARG